MQEHELEIHFNRILIDELKKRFISTAGVREAIFLR